MNRIRPITIEKSRVKFIRNYSYSIWRITRPGFPTTIEFRGTSFVTTVFAPITLFCPIFYIR